VACPSWIYSNPAWVNVVDSTTGRDGTRFNRAFFLQVQQYIDELTGVYYGLPSPANVAAEIEAARGNADCLDTRLDVAIDEDGNIKLPPTVATKDDVAGLVSENLCGNDLLLANPDGDAAAPGFWANTGVVTSWANAYADGFGRTLVVGGGAAATVYQELIPASMVTRARLLLAHADGIGFGVSVATAQSGVRAFVTDGTVTKYSAVHGAGGSEEWLKADPIPINASSQYLRVGIEVPAGVSVSFYAPMASIGPAAPKGWKPGRHRQVITPFQIVGNVLTAYEGATKFQFAAPGDGVLESLWMGASGAMPAAMDATWTLSRYHGSGWDTVDTIGLGATQQYQYKETTVADQLRVCWAPRLALNARCRLFAFGLSSTGAGPHASDIFVAARWKVWERPLYTFFNSGL